MSHTAFNTQSQARAHWQNFAWAGSLLLLLGLSVGLNRWLEQHRAGLGVAVEDQPLYATDAGVKRFVLAFNGLAADWYWLRTLQYLGGKALAFRAAHPGEPLPFDNLSPLDPRQLYPLLDRATTLDPQFLAAYEYGGVVLPAVNSDDAIRLLRKGIANNPNAWRLYHHLGYTYWKRGEYDAASEIYAQASRIPDAPFWLPAMSARVKIDGGGYDTARLMYEQMAQTSDDPNIKNIAAARLKQIQSLIERAAIRQVLQDFRTHKGRCANSWHEVLTPLRAVRLADKHPLYFDKSGTPLDPADTAYRLTENGCEVDLDTHSAVPYR